MSQGDQNIGLLLGEVLDHEDDIPRGTAGDSILALDKTTYRRGRVAGGVPGLEDLIPGATKAMAEFVQGDLLLVGL